MGIIPSTWHDSWDAFLVPERIDILKDIEKNIGKKYYPDPHNVLRFLQLDIDVMKCVIVGMDPYPSDYVFNGEVVPIATGRSFEVDNISDWQQKFKQSSLRNILKTIYFNETGNKESLENIREKIKEGNFNPKQPKEWFNSVEKQGVLFLNASLTTRPNCPGSHSEIWKPFMSDLISFIDTNYDVKWLLWGREAQKLTKLLATDKTKIIECVHPRLPEFIDENCFGKVKSINWMG